MKLYPHQQANADQLARVIREGRVGLDASDTGTGKTYTALAVANQLGLPVAVVCPKIVKPSWCNGILSMGAGHVFVENYEKLRTGRTDWLNSLGTGKRKTLFWDLPEKCMLIFDEAHKGKGRDTLNSKMIEAARRQRIPTLLATATPAANPLEMKALGYALGLHSHAGQPKFWKWATMYGARQAWHGGWEVPKNKVAKAMADINEVLGGQLVRTKVEELTHFPENVITADVYEMASKDINKAYASVDEDDLAITQLLRVRKAIELIKVPFFRDLALESIEAGKSAVIFLNFRESILELHAQLNEELNPGCGLIIGDQREKDRQGFIDMFQADKIRAIVSQSGAGGVGLSLHDLHGNHPRESFISPGYSAVELVQLLGRIPRAGAKSKAVQRIIFAAGTPEEKACELVQKKVTNIRSLTDGDLAGGLKLT